MLIAYHPMVNIAKKPLPYRRYTLIAVAIAGLCVGGWFFGQNRYHHWRAGRLAQQAGEPISCPANTPKCDEILKGISGLDR